MHGCCACLTVPRRRQYDLAELISSSRRRPLLPALRRRSYSGAMATATQLADLERNSCIAHCPFLASLVLQMLISISFLV